MAKPAATAKKAQEEPVAPPKKSKKKLILMIAAAAVLLVAGGIVAFLLLKPAPSAKHGGAAGTEAAESEEKHSETPPKFVDLGQFTANLMHEEDDRVVQATIALKITKPELEEKIKEARPEILHRVNMLLQSRRPSELSSVEGKEKLAQQIKVQTEHILGLRKSAPPIGIEQAASAVSPVAVKTGITDVLFTSFIIQ